MIPVVQEDSTGCAIACAATVSGMTYRETRRVAAALGICVDDPALWSDTRPIARLLNHLGFRLSRHKTPFMDWQSLPDLALLAIKWHRGEPRPHWHWVVFVREGGAAFVFDPKRGLATNIRTDFGRMKPKWFLRLRR